MTRAAVRALRVVLAIGVMWLLGFGWFEHRIRQKSPPQPRADGIIALTGGADRIETALRLLDAGLAPVLLISGVGRVDLAELANRAQLDPARIAPRVTLGHVAQTTLGNADEAVAWVEKHRITTLAVVTAGYHMPRALLELHRTLPGVTLMPIPVFPPALRRPAAPGTLVLLANEFDKLLAAIVRLPR